jgi:hypothetical protein
LGSITFMTVLSLATGGCHENTQPTREQSAQRQSGVNPTPGGKTVDNSLPPPPALKLEAVRDQKPAPAPDKAAKTEHAEKKAKSETPTGSGVTIKRLVVTNAIEDREPTQVSGLALGDAPVIAFVELVNAGDEDGAVVVTFEHDGIEPVGHVNLRVPAHSRRWRTWARTRMIKKPGSWQAVVRTPDGKELARESFQVAP